MKKYTELLSTFANLNMKAGTHIYEFINSSSEVFVPEYLTPRNELTVWVATAFLALSFFIIAFARMSSVSLMTDLGKIMLKNKNVEKIVREGYSLNSFFSIFLSVNYLISFTGILYLSYQYFQMKFQLSDILFLSIFPVYFLFWPVLSLRFLGIVTGENESIREVQMNNWVLPHFSGLVYSFILLIWCFNLQWTVYFFYIFFSYTLIMYLFRFIRGFIFTFQKGVSWYYIILYFCTLEILPLVILYVLYGSFLLKNSLVVELI